MKTSEWRYKKCPGCGGKLEKNFSKSFNPSSDYYRLKCVNCNKIFGAYHKDTDLESLPIGIIINDELKIIDQN